MAKTRVRYRLGSDEAKERGYKNADRESWRYKGQGECWTRGTYVVCNDPPRGSSGQKGVERGALDDFHRDRMEVGPPRAPREPAKKKGRDKTSAIVENRPVVRKYDGDERLTGKDATYATPVGKTRGGKVKLKLWDWDGSRYVNPDGDTGEEGGKIAPWFDDWDKNQPQVTPGVNLSSGQFIEVDGDDFNSQFRVSRAINLGEVGNPEEDNLMTGEGDTIGEDKTTKKRLKVIREDVGEKFEKDLREAGVSEKAARPAATGFDLLRRSIRKSKDSRAERELQAPAELEKEYKRRKDELEKRLEGREDNIAIRKEAQRLLGGTTIDEFGAVMGVGDVDRMGRAIGTGRAEVGGRKRRGQGTDQPKRQDVLTVEDLKAYKQRQREDLELEFYEKRENLELGREGQLKRDIRGAKRAGGKIIGGRRPTVMIEDEYEMARYDARKEARETRRDRAELGPGQRSTGGRVKTIAPTERKKPKQYSGSREMFRENEDRLIEVNLLNVRLTQEEMRALDRRETSPEQHRQIGAKIEAAKRTASDKKIAQVEARMFDRATIKERKRAKQLMDQRGISPIGIEGQEALRNIRKEVRSERKVLPGPRGAKPRITRDEEYNRKRARDAKERREKQERDAERIRIVDGMER